MTAGVQFTSSTPTSFGASTDILGTNFTDAGAGTQGYWLLNVASAGNDNLTLATNASENSTPDQFEVFLNDKQVGGIFTQDSPTDFPLGTLALSSGLNTLSVVVVNQGSQFLPTSFTLTPATNGGTGGGNPISNGGFGIVDPGFENEVVGTGQYLYDPTSLNWMFSGTAGISGNGSDFTVGNPSAPQGSQVAFIQGIGSFSQVVTGWTAGPYTIAFDAAERGNYGGLDENFEVLVDGVVVGTFKPSGTTYQGYSTPSFTVTAGSHTIAFVGLDTSGGDNTSLIDALGLTNSSSTPTLGDSGFESESVGSSGYVYDPSSTSWTFSGGSGVSGNGSAFTSGNASAPEGSQVAFIQGTGSFSQVVSSWSAGSYLLTFSAAQRGNFGTSVEDFEVLVDGVLVATFKPSGTSYQRYATPSFSVSSGSHTIAFVGLDSAGGDNTAFIDNISLS